MARIPECDIGNRSAWTQAAVNARWAAIGNPGGIAPILPPSMEGWYLLAGRGPRKLTRSPTGKLKKSSLRNVTAEENNFLNVFNQIACDPYRKQSGISKVAGNILQVAAFALPALSTVQAVADTGNAALSLEKAGVLAKDATKLLTQAATQAAEMVYQPAPATLVAPVTSLVPQSVTTVTQAPARGRAQWARKDYLIAAGAAVFIYLLVRRVRR